MSLFRQLGREACSPDNYKKLILGLMTSAIFLHSVPPVAAFDNAIRKVETPKTNGPKPANLGLDKDGLLRMCSKPSPNCFSTTPDTLGSDDDDDDLSQDFHFIKKWRYLKGNALEGYHIIGEVLDAYQPGQADIDGGGFKVITRDKDKLYYYVQFESLKRGYIDDFEIAINADCSIQVVSSSRLGYLDLRVNSKRINYIAKKLSNLGFECYDITPSSHPVYFDSNMMI